jgi:hypothetical protein
LNPTWFNLLLFFRAATYLEETLFYSPVAHFFFGCQTIAGEELTSPRIAVMEDLSIMEKS